MSKVWLTSDTHFCHNQEFIYKSRGFNSVDEMNEAIVERWNSVVKSDDMVFVLGDFMLNDNEKGIEYIKRLNGWLLAVWGNHDSIARQQFIYEHHPIIMGMGYAHQFKHNKLTCYLSHYPTLTANYDEKHFNQHVINFHGHVHNKTPWINPRNPFMYDVGMDAHNCYPVHIETAIADIRNRWNEIGQLPISTKSENTYPYGGML